METSPIDKDADVPETLFGLTGGLQLQFSYGKWPGGGMKGVDTDVFSCDGRHTNLYIRRHPRTKCWPTNIIHGDKVVASVDMVPAEERSRTKNISIHSLEEEDVSGSINSSVGADFHLSYKAEACFPRSDLPSYKCKSGPGPLGPQIQIFSDDDQNSCVATIRDVTKPFDERKTVHISVAPLADTLSLYIILCIAADVVNEMHIFERRKKQNQMISIGLNLVCPCTIS